MIDFSLLSTILASIFYIISSNEIGLYEVVKCKSCPGFYKYFDIEDTCNQPYRGLIQKDVLLSFFLSSAEGQVFYVYFFIDLFIMFIFLFYTHAFVVCLI